MFNTEKNVIRIDRNGMFESQMIGKRQIRIDEIEKSPAMYFIPILYKTIDKAASALSIA